MDSSSGVWERFFKPKEKNQEEGYSKEDNESSENNEDAEKNDSTNDENLQSKEKPEEDNAVVVEKEEKDKKTNATHVEADKNIINAVLSSFPTRDAGGLDAAVNNVIKKLGIDKNSSDFDDVKEKIRILLTLKQRIIRDRNRELIGMKEEIRKQRQFKSEEGYSPRSTDLKKLALEADGLKNKPRKYSNNSDYIEEQRLSAEREKKNEMNMDDSAFIKEIRQYIEENPQEAEEFWKEFSAVFKEEGGRHRNKLSGEFNTAEKIKSGVLGELAGKQLFSEEQFLAELKENLEYLIISEISQRNRGYADGSGNVNFGGIEISVEESDTEQDVFGKADFLIKISYGNEDIELPVQIKCIYSHGERKKEEEDIKKNTCSFSHSSFLANEQLNKKRRQFFNQNKDGIFVILPRGFDNLEISDDGEPSEELKNLFRPAVKDALYNAVKEKLLLSMVRRNIREQGNRGSRIGR